MQKPSPNFLASYRTFQGQATLFGQMIVIAMMVTLGAGFALAGARIITGWRGGYLIAVALILSLEAIYTRSRTRELEGREKAIFHVTEWIAFLVALKILIYLLNEPAQLLKDLPLWQSDFLGSFFTGEYVIGIGLALLVWFSSRSYANELDEINEREEDTAWDELGKLQNALHSTREKIASRVFILGILIVFMAIVSRVEVNLLKNISQARFAATAPVVNVLIYFTLALILLSQTQFSLLRTRWRWQRLNISINTAKNWIRYTLLFCLALGVVVFFLPTHYTIGLLDVLRILIGYIFQGVSLILYLFTLPLTICLSLFRFSTGEPVNMEPASQIQIITAPDGSQPFAWVEFLKSLLFWVVFLGVIIFAIRYYFSQNTALWKSIKNIPLFQWIADIFKGISDWLKNANRQVGSLVKSGIQRLRKTRIPSPTRLVQRFVNFSQLNPREKVIYFYLNMINLGSEKGLARRPSETPYQYNRRLSSVIPEVDQELSSLTDEFVEARYSPHDVRLPDAENANTLWERIKAVLREWRYPDTR